MVLIDIERTFSENGKNIRLLVTEVLLCAAASNLAKSKNLRDRTARNAVLFPPLLMEIALTARETAEEALLKIFAEGITNQEAEKAAEELDADKESRSDENKKKSAKTRSTKDAMARDTTEGIVSNCNDILAFPQAVALKSLRVQA